MANSVSSNSDLPVSDQLPGTAKRQRATKHLLILSAVAIGMFIFAYVNAEFFVMLCQKAGLLATPPSDVRVEAVDGRQPGRDLQVFFTAKVNDDLPIAFSVENSFQKSQVNVANENWYRFSNLSNDTLYIRPIHDVYPTKAGLEGTMELLKCFCFDEQKLEPGQSYKMPVQYVFNDNLEEKVGTITMSYTITPSTKEQYEASLIAAENAEAAAKADKAGNAAEKEDPS